MSRIEASPRSVINFVTQLEGGGAQMVAAQLRAGFAELGFDSLPLTFLYKKRDFDFPGPKPVILSETKPDGLGILKLLSAIFRQLRTQKPEIVLSHSVYTNLFVLPLAAMLRIPHRITVQHNETQDVSTPIQFLYALFHVLNITTHTVFVSEASHRSYLAKYRFFAHKSSVVKNLISIDWSSADLDVLRLANLQNGERLLFCVGRLSRQKNHTVLVEAMKQVADCKLLIAGEGELRPELEAQIKEAGLESSVILAGEIPREKIVALFGTCDLFVMPSLYEGRSLAMLEAVQAGCSIVASRIPSFEETLQSCSNDVIFFDVSSADDLARGLQSSMASMSPWQSLEERVLRLQEKSADSDRNINVELAKLYCQGIGWSFAETTYDGTTLVTAPQQA